MKQTVKAKWVARLRSGDYKQGKNALRNKDNEFCCLGVLCDIHAQETGTPWFTEGDLNTYRGAIGSLPRVVRDWAGIHEALPGVPHIGRGLAEMNDNGWTFDQIADMIERHM